MLKAMLFIDGSWLHANQDRLGGSGGVSIDYGLLPRVVCDALVASAANLAGLTLVRTHLFGSYAVNHAPADEAAVQRRLGFYQMLRERYLYDVSAYGVDFRGKRVSRAEREPDDDFAPVEKEVDIGLATALLTQAVLPGAYDVAIVVAGDRDFLPALLGTRRLGKQVAIASIWGACSQEYVHPGIELPRDHPIVWLDQIADRFTSERGPGPASNGAAAEEQTLRGVVERVFPEREYGFLQGENQLNYHFHFSRVREIGADEVLREGDEVDFAVRREPVNGQAGSVHFVIRR